MLRNGPDNGNIKRHEEMLDGLARPVRADSGREAGPAGGHGEAGAIGCPAYAWTHH
jgi:hypothetical protein